MTAGQQTGSTSRAHDGGPVVLGLDVGGSSVKHLLAPARSTTDAPPAPIARGRHATPKDSPVAGLAAIASSLRGEAALERVVLSIPGLVDEAEGVVVRSTNIPALDGRPLGAQLAAELGIPVDVINDGHAAAVAEASWGAGAGIDDVFVLALGTGIAGAHVVGGRVVPGAHGSAGELGHITIEPDGRVCSCGRRGCLETIIGAPALRRAWAEAGGAGGPETLLAASGAGDAAATAIVERASAALAEAILTLCALVDPGCVVIGGGLAQAPHRIVHLAERYVGERASFHRVPPIVPATLGEWAGANGAVLTALRRQRALV
ncbi:ROK family protein [Streptomyces sp. AC495_CC817]|uniref:ROK family protein n=1 Tax=Streptomyces sp. AC495_CC817 TaxID=2823900 RepID=UPI001C270EEF|nr:ROK family protein [Streptomyces sp. AC495_CC817]